MKYSKLTHKLSGAKMALMVICILAALSFAGCTTSSGQTGQEAVSGETTSSEETTSGVVESVEDTSEVVESGEDTSEVAESGEDTSEVVESGEDTSEVVESGEDTSEVVESVETTSEETTSEAVQSDEGQSTAKELLQVEVLKVGKADAIVLMCGGQTMVIDCGEEEDGQEVLDYLEAQGEDKIDVLLITHFDKDHVGGAETVVEGIAIDRVLLPAYEGTSKKYKNFIKALEEAGITPDKVEDVQTLQLESASVTVEPPASYEMPDSEEEYDNNFSLITTVVFGSNRLVFTGDIEEERIEEWLASGTVQPCDVLKIPHHGSYNEELVKMVAVMKPSYAIICDSEKNPAEGKTVSMLEEIGAKCLQTKNGDISIVCDGESIEADQ